MCTPRVVQTAGGAFDWMCRELNGTQRALMRDVVDPLAHTDDWEARVEAQAALSRSRCNRQRDMPRVAFCIAGAARSFATPLVLAMLRHRLLASHTASRLFLQLKTEDSDKFTGAKAVVGQINFRKTNVSNDALSAAIATDWLRNVTGEVALVRSSGAYVGGDAAATVELAAVVTSHAGDTELWRQYASPCAANSSGYLKTGNNQERMIYQLLGQLWCRGAIERFERRIGVQFDQVVFARPDFLWMEGAPVRWCAPANLASEGKAVWFAFKPGCDMVWAAPRKYLAPLLSMAETHRDCHAEKKQNLGRKAACCHTPEYLLNFVIYKHGIPTDARAALKSGYDYDALRNVQALCDIVLRPSYTRSQVVWTHVQHGLPATVGFHVRALFLTPTCVAGSRNKPADARPERECLLECRQALGRPVDDLLKGWP